MGWNLKSDRPIYSQLIEQIELMIVSGIYPAGSKLPSVRDMAGEASVNPNTMQRALAQLETEGLLYSQRTSGRFVTEDVERIMQTKQNLAMDLVNTFMASMNHLGYNREQIISLINHSAEEDQ
ncbi:MAG: GntR family transcriptional regulator [Clostridiales bacterium]|jgi:DNA-binding transcriptional regulator YhcF (GntR family)|nr:GntR family transcriptional regulator [Clostridiales bacterium]